MTFFRSWGSVVIDCSNGTAILEAPRRCKKMNSLSPTVKLVLMGVGAAASAYLLYTVMMSPPHHHIQEEAEEKAKQEAAAKAAREEAREQTATADLHANQDVRGGWRSY